MDTKLIVVGSAKNQTIKRIPRIRLSGFWLNEVGFEFNTVVSVNYEDGNLVLQRHESGKEAYFHLADLGLRRRSFMLRVSRDNMNNQRPQLILKGYWLDEFDFNIGAVAVVRYEYGIIKMKVLDKLLPPERQ